MSSSTTAPSAFHRRPAFVWLIAGACGLVLMGAIIASTPAWTINEVSVALNREVSDPSSKAEQELLARLEAALARGTPGTASFWRTYGAAAARQPTERAFDLLQSAQQQGLLDRTGQLWFGEVASKTGHRKEAMQAFAEVDATNLLVDRAEKAVAQGSRDIATNWYLVAADNVRRAIDRDAALAGSSASAAGAEDLTTGVEKVVHRTGTRAVALLRIGSGLVGLGRPEDAIPSLELAISEMHANPPGTHDCQSIQFTLAMALAQTMPTENEAAQTQATRVHSLIDHALALDHTASAYLQAGGVLRRLGARAEALDDLRAAIDLDPRLANAYLTMGAMLNEDGLPSLARDIYQSGVRMLPGNSLLVSAYAKSAYLTMAPQQALPLLENAVKLNPNDPYVYAFLGDCRLDLGDVTAARATYLEGLRKFPGAEILTDRLAQPPLRPTGITP